MQAKIGETIVFERDGMEITGIVIKKYERSILIEIVTPMGGDFPYDRTVVNHQKYRLCIDKTK
ncbi:DUF2187 family protein [Bacillus cereus]|uniref:DUF2187 domain-containing protein n=2 Tax=Bacillus cereus group TaxID=86661 RepID=A0A9W5KRF4_BACCE|nr:MULTISPECIES: DUF2187 family protein [Bacillus cereus group]MEB8734176.1 DUF2187 family protein [Bacillus cereus]EEM48113.1 hypothetical protein bthur0005_19750 [Bacillus thuringiensis serovar pakistani str. T13001]EJR64170.1 hypothetical protein IK5_05775 [Bacillus cereus VD154]KIU73164.1 GNAT family acetyltransferase [Bacillus thuringiensis Sbt003]MBG9503767.1 hypothetical protein [Bacillus thuringiensis]